VPGPRSIVVMHKRDGLGEAQVYVLRQKQGEPFLSPVVDGHLPPGVMCFCADGGELACEGSPVIVALQSLESSGVRLVLCTVCLNDLGLADKVPRRHGRCHHRRVVHRQCPDALEGDPRQTSKGWVSSPGRNAPPSRALPA
jgi:hypothetical protein